MTEHTVKAYEHELKELGGLLCDMGRLVESQFRDSVEALVKRDELIATRVIVADEATDKLQNQIEQMAIHLIAKRQPLACDLREIVAAFRISIDLERVGDFAKNIAKRLSVLNTISYPGHLANSVEQMADVALVQLRKVLNSYESRDVNEAIAVWRGDEEVDAIYTSLFRELLTYMMEQPRNITFSTHLLFCGKNIERIGDHATNIAETIYYMVVGSPLTAERPKDDRTISTASAP